ncbi:MAG TPA: 50S ribosomal protein L30 [Solirubrobacteraceae bacterium]|nr:50S ribosomal protein L30 [Solirubrobacteraceae bacterium]
MSAIRLTQRKSRNGSDKRQRATLRSLGLRRIGHTVEVSDSPQVRGMIAKVRHLVEIAESDPEKAGS